MSLLLEHMVSLDPAAESEDSAPDLRARTGSEKPLRFSVVRVALDMADHCRKTGRTEELRGIVTNLIALSQERNADDPKKHRIVVVQALERIVDLDRDLTARICDAQRGFFLDIADAEACNFTWFYAISLLSAGRAEESIPMLKTCYDLCMAVEGDTSWTGARAGSLYQYAQLTSGDAAAAEAYLWDTLQKIDGGYYRSMDDTADFVAAGTRSTLLRWRMERQNLRGLLPELERFRDYCVSVENTNINPNLTVRHAENLLSGYYLETGDYLQAADHALQALHSVSAAVPNPEPSDILIYTNLLLIYIGLNDEDRMTYYVQKLTDLYPEFEDDDFVLSRVSLLINTAAKKMHVSPEDWEEDRQYLTQFSRDLLEHGFEPSESAAENVTFAQWILDLCSGIMDSGTATKEDLIHFRRIADFFMSSPQDYPFNDTQKVTCYMLLTQIAWLSGSPDALEHLESCLRYAGAIHTSRETSISILRFAAIVYHNYNRPKEALDMVEQVLAGITSAWRKATSYLNDRRVCELLSFIQLYFNVCCSIMRTGVGSEELYERVLQFKDLPALVGRERNRLLRMAPVDESLKQEIFALQDRLAAAELNDSLQGTDTAQRLAAELERKESEFAAQFPQNLYFTDITFENVCGKLPDDSAIVEYYFVLGEDALSQQIYDDEKVELDIFVTARKRGKAQLHHIRLPRGDLIAEQAEEFTDILQDPDEIVPPGRKKFLRTELYRSLIAPALPFLDGISTLYIAPDKLLCNLPFEILYDEGTGLLQDTYKVCRLMCGRDILFYDDLEPAGGSFILGDPNYESQRGEQAHSHLRGGFLSLEPVCDLPFSGIEARRIGRRCRCGIYSGDAATKYALQQALPCRIIHLATHGMFDDQLMTDSLYASNLVFAGYNSWVTRKTESSHCGNGILTADEISRMDLRKTELVVLSACQSGLGDTSYGSVRGLLSAFSAAGARWVISHMWEASDFSTPILMDAFYDAYLNRGMEVPDALQYAKDYLRNVTIRQIREDGWLDLPEGDRFPEEIREAVADMGSWPDENTPFSDEFFWGGFTVHKSR